MLKRIHLYLKVFFNLDLCKCCGYFVYLIFFIRNHHIYFTDENTEVREVK